MRIKLDRYREVAISTFAVAFECQDCGALTWRSGQEAHDRFHVALRASGLELVEGEVAQ